MSQLSMPGQTVSGLTSYISGLIQAMLRKRSNTAILVFIRSAAEEAAAKDFGSRLGQNARRRISGLLNNRARQVARGTGLPVLVVSGRQQQGSDFGERFAHALAGAFAQGFDKVIAIGNDCLTLSPATVQRAAEELEQASYVFGPSRDGGVYLLGMCAEKFDKNVFIQLPWQTENLFRGLADYAGDENIALLPHADDADDEAGLTAALSSLQSNRPLRRRLENVLRLTITLAAYPPVSFRMVAAVRQFLLRAPPALCR